MKRHTLILVLLAAALVVGFASDALANCQPDKLFSSWNVGALRYHYINFGDLSGDPNNLLGHYYQTTDSSVHSGTYPIQAWLGEYYVNSDGWYLNGSLGDARNTAGCIADCLTVEVHNTATDNGIAITVSENPVATPEFDFSQLGVNFTAGPHRLRATSSTRIGLNVDVGCQADDPTTQNIGACAAAVDNVNVYTTNSDGPPSQNIVDGGWQLHETLGPAGGPCAVPVTCDCSVVTVDCWIASGLVINGQPPVAVGPATQVECDPNLADPRLKRIDRPTAPGKTIPKR